MANNKDNAFGQDTIEHSYRIQKHEWQGTPAEDPVVVVEKSECGYRLGYVSWNGATDIEGWNVYAGADGQKLGFRDRITKTSFETRFNVDGEARCVQLGAVREGAEIRKSKIVCDSGG